MAHNWREIVEQIDAEPQPTSGPAGAEDSEWFELLTAFGTTSFIRVLTDGGTIALECAPPGDATRAREAFERADWTVVDKDATPWVVQRAFPDDGEVFRDQWVEIAKLADAFRSDDSERLKDVLADSAHLARAAETSAAGESPADEQSEETTGTGSKRVSGGAKRNSSPAFETIGDDDREALEEGEFDSALRVVDEVVEVVLGFGDVLDGDDYGAVGDRIVKNLRGKYDVDAKVVGGNEVSVELEKLPMTRLALHVVPDSVVSDASLDDAEEWTGTYLETLRNIANSGIDPLVFLGVRSSNRKPSESSKRDRSAPPLEPIGSERDTDSDEPEGPVLVVADDVDDGDDEESGGEADVVFGETEEIGPHDPLKAGRYDDPRLDRTDATTSLVDVVLRHPGYSDRRIGQVLSILLSLDYARCLQIAERAPTVIAWGVARERAQTMKTVIEGAGGKVLLCEPDEFGEP